MRPLTALIALPAAVGIAALASSPALAATPTPTPATPVQLFQARYTNPAVIATVPSAGSAAGYAVKLGGFSALAAYRNADGTTSATDFWTLSDRGANGSGPTPTGSQLATQGFVVPSFAPTLLHISVSGGTVSVVKRVPFHLPTGDLDPARADATNAANTGSSCAAATGSFVGPDTFNGNTCNTVTGLGINPDEEADYSADQTTQLHPDPYGLDTESLAVAPDGSFFVGDEYTPSVVHIAADGTELRRYVPVGYSLLDGISPFVPVSKVLPNSWNNREINKGTEGLAISPDGTHVYAGLQGPLNLPCSTDASPTTFEGRQSLRLADLNMTAPNSPTLNHEWLYLTDAHSGSTKYFDSDMSSDATTGRVLVDERDSKDVQKDIYSFDPNGAQTDLLNVPAAEDTASSTTTTGSGTTSNAGCFDKAPPASVTPVAKTLVANLLGAATPAGTAAPYEIFKIEGIVLMPNGTLAVVNDNDFGYTQTGSGSGTSYADNTSTSTGPDSQLREYALTPAALAAYQATAAASLPEAPYAVLLPLIALGAIGGVVAVRRRGTRISAH